MSPENKGGLVFGRDTIREGTLSYEQDTESYKRIGVEKG